MKNSALWKLAEEGSVSKGDIFIDEEGNELIYTGKAFQVYFSEKDSRYEYIGMCLNDNWTFLRNDIHELEMQANERK